MPPPFDTGVARTFAVIGHLQACFNRNRKFASNTANVHCLLFEEQQQNFRISFSYGIFGMEFASKQINLILIHAKIVTVETPEEL